MADVYAEVVRNYLNTDELEVWIKSYTTDDKQVVYVRILNDLLQQHSFTQSTNIYWIITTCQAQC